MTSFHSHKNEPISSDKITELFDKIQKSRSIDKLVEMQNEISELHEEALIGRVGMWNLDLGRTYNSEYSDVLSFLASRINLLNPNFALNPKISHDEIVNGYNLYDCSVSIYCYSDFIEYEKLFNDNSNENTSFEDFYEKFDDIACTEWSKMNTTGDDWYVGFWKAEEGSEENKNAWYLTRRQNARALFDLPYSKTFLLKTVSNGCANRMESVRYSNFLCVWFERKLKLINNSNIEIDENALNDQYENYKKTLDEKFIDLYPKISVPTYLLDALKGFENN